MSEQKTAREILGKVDKDVIAVRMGDRTVDLHTPIDASAQLTPIRATDPLGLAVIRHSTAHVMADAVQRLFPGTKVTIGPAIDDGFYYDFAKAEGTFTEEDLAKIERAMFDVINKNTPFRRVVVTRDQAIEKFEQMGETFKVEIIRSIPEGEEISLYEHGSAEQPWVDVCEGPHVPSTGFLKAIKLTSVAGAYWRGDERNPMLQRIYGTAFPTKEALVEHLKLLEEARARDHRKLGKELELFMFDELAPAMPFFLPKGAYVYNRLVDFMRGLYEREGYQEVITPMGFSPKLFATSGHLENYHDNMFRLWTDDVIVEALADASMDAKKLHAVLDAESFALKPMNCPSHCKIFSNKKRSYRDLPWRMADFGRLHRYERGGVVHGMARVRSFAQDDGHIFCAEEDVAAEIERFIKLLYRVYQTFKFEKIDIKLAMRPEKRIGTDAEWDIAEGALESGLKAAGLPFEVLPNEGAFYGPKVEFHIQDALKRSWQLGTIQYDKNLPNRFDLEYTGSDGKGHRPIMLHRAILGSLERFFAVYLEHVGGNFPTWISPRQVMIITVHEDLVAYGKKVRDTLVTAGIRADLDDGRDKLGAKIRNARNERYPFLCVVGQKEQESNSVGVRSRDKGELGAIDLAKFVEMVKAETLA